MSPAPESQSGGYLIIGGTTKAATTSLFTHLAAHPRVRPCRIKEPRFFLDPRYPLERSVSFDRGRAAYDALFPGGSAGGLCLEATPDYLHSPGAARRMEQELADVRVVFSLRDPLDRLVSWYRFARSAARLPPAMSLREYVEAQLRLPHPAHPDSQPLRALAQGRYADDLAAFLEELGPARVHVVFYEDLQARPREVIDSIAAFAGLDPGFFHGRELAVHNPTREVKRARLHRGYLRLAFRLRNLTVRQPRVFSALRRAHQLVRPLYWRWNARGEDVPDVPDDLTRLLIDHYAPSVRQLEQLLGRSVPWKNFAARAP